MKTPSPHRLGILHLSALGVNATIGSGIFLIPGMLAAGLGAWSPFAFLVCGLLLHLVALTFARMARLTERNGGPYLYASLAFGARGAFLVGWIAWICTVVSGGAAGNAIGTYLAHFTGPLEPLVGKMVAVIFILIFAIINYFGVRQGGRAMVILTLLKLIPLLALGGGGLALLATRAPPLLAGPTVAPSLSLALILCLFTCQGFEVVPIIAGETEDPRRVVPRAILCSLWISVALYIVIQVGIAAGPAVGSKKPLADQAQFLWGRFGGGVVAAAGLLSAIGFVAGITLAAPRFITALCEDGLLPKGLAAQHPRFESPGRAIALTCGLLIVFTLFSEIKELIALSALSVALQYLASVLAFLFLSSRRGMSEGWVAASGALGVALLFLWQIPATSWRTFLVVVAGGYFLQWASRHFPESPSVAVV